MLCMAQTKKELVLFFIITSVGMVLFGSAVFYCEKDEADTGFISIPGWSCVVGNVGAVLLCLTPCVFACMHAQAICKCKMQSTTKRTSAWLSCLWACPHFAPILLKDTTPLPFCVNHANPPASPSSFSFSFLPPPLSLSFSPPPLPSSSTSSTLCAAGFWWAIVTMTTVGYGDISPVTIQGQIVGGIAATLGVVLVAIPAGIFISEFMRLHQERQLSEQENIGHVRAMADLQKHIDELFEKLETYNLTRDVHDKRMRNKLHKYRKVLRQYAPEEAWPSKAHKHKRRLQPAAQAELIRHSLNH